MSAQLSQQSNQIDLVYAKYNFEGKLIWAKTLYSDPKTASTNYDDVFSGASISKHGYIFLVIQSNFYTKSGTGNNNLRFIKISKETVDLCHVLVIYLTYQS
ncbi:UNKNOWN [Stylonychia lemnae]|uniref:Uncharacterized protein n=1 Tax=Stylonychia lemnae TaxID=5949 RepID=A0A078A6D1_STYLE|nr:UNKNOWN [Stylonychia lemnae]|eukprot:CDW77416.1 UNKNOWN [Stylonychia lemnae]